MMVGRTPFANERGVNLMKLAQGKYDPIDSNLGYSQPLLSLVYLCLSVDASKRPTAGDMLASPVASKAQEAAVLVGRVREIVSAAATAAAVRSCEERMRKEFEEKIVSLRKELNEKYEKRRNAKIVHVRNRAGVSMDCLLELRGVTVKSVMTEDFASVANELSTFDLLVLGGTDGADNNLTRLESFKGKIEAFRKKGGAVLLLHDTTCMYGVNVTEAALPEFLPSVNADVGWTRVPLPFYQTNCVRLEGFHPVLASPNRIPRSFAVEVTHGDLIGQSRGHTLAVDSYGQPFLMANWEGLVAKVETGHVSRATVTELELIVNVVHHLLLCAGK